MIKIFTLIVKMAPLLMVLFAVVITVFTYILIRTRIKNRKVSKTLKLFSDLKHEQQQLAFILSHSKDSQYKKISFYNYLDEQEAILNLMENRKIDPSLFDDLIKPQIIEFMHINIMNSYISEIQSNIRNNKTSKRSYKYLTILINEHDKNRIIITTK